MSVSAKVGVATIKAVRAIGSTLGTVAGAYRVAKRAFYAAAESNRLTQGFRTQRGMGPDRPAIVDGATIRARIYELERNNAIMDNAIRAFTNGVLPTPILVEPNVTRRREMVPGEAINAKWNDQASALFDAWGSGPCDFSGWDSHRETLAMITRKICRAVFTDMECFIVRRRRAGGPGMPRLQIECIESDRLGNNVALSAASYGLNDERPGIEYDATGRPAFYNFSKATSGFTVETERVAARDVLHIFLPHRPGAQTGKLTLASCLMAFFHLGNVVESELAALDYLTRIAGVVTGDDSLGEEDGGNDSTGNAFQLANTEAATVYRSSAQGNFTAFKVDRPNTGFDKTCEVFIRWIAAGTGVPYSLLAANYNGLNFSVSRAERMAWKPTLSIWQDEVIIAQFLRPLYSQWFVEQAVMDGLLSIPFGLTLDECRAATYRHPRLEYMDPQTEVQADILAVQGGMMSPQEVCAARGQNYYEIIDQIAEAKRYAEKAGVNHLAIFAPPTGSAAPVASQSSNAVPPPQSPRSLPEIAPEENRYG